MKSKQNVWFIHGKAYDLSKFLAIHPGGSDILNAVRGIDATELFETYHFRVKPSEELLSKYQISLNELSLSETEKKLLLERPWSFKEGGFFRDCRSRVKDFFDGKKLDHHAPSLHKANALVQLFLLLIFLYFGFVNGDLFAAFLHGFFRGLTGLTLAHGASHFSIFKPSFSIWLLFFCGPVLLSSQGVWNMVHILTHHIITLTKDDFTEIMYPIKRVIPRLQHKSWHKYQQYYIWIIYLFGIPLWTLSDFAESIESLYTGNYKGRYQIPKLERCIHVFSFILQIYVNIYLPFHCMDFWRAFAVFILSNFAASFIIIFQIMVNHQVPEASLHIPDEHTDWGAYQTITAHNYAVNSKLFLHLSGGLNMQIEHHLFPSVHYSFYYDIAPIVKKCCKDHKLPYNESSTIWEALQKHQQLLTILSQEKS